MNHEEAGCHSDSRISYIDMARGFALLLLVLGHIATGNSFLFNWIFSFHMPLFFFLAGMCAKETEIGFSLYLKKKAKKRLLPYFLIVFIGFLICMLIPSYRKVIINDGFLLQAKHIFLLMKPLNLYIGQAWFLASLFWAEIYFFLWYRLCKNQDTLLQLSLAVFLVVIARNLWRVQEIVPILGRIPFHMDSACMGAFCYMLGFLTRKYRVLEQLACFGRWGALLPLPALGINLYFGPFLNGYVNMCDLVFGNMFFFLISMISGIIAVVVGAFYVKKCHILEWYGRHSLPLFASHTFLIYLVRYGLFEINGIQYTMMENVPWKVALVMTGMVGLLFGVVGLLFDEVMGK